MAYAMVPIFTQTVGAGGASFIAFNNIPSNYTDLRLDISARSTHNSNDNLRLSINSDASALYSQTAVYGDGSSAYSERGSGANIYILDFASGALPNSSSTANTFSNLSVYIPNYTASTFKQVITDNVSENNAAATFIRTTLGAGLYRSTASINRISINCFYNLAQHSTFTLYGIKNA